jgi:Na+/H+ antiporter NhaC
MNAPVDLAATAWTTIPIILTIACVFLTKRILLSMTVGIVSASFMVANFNLFQTIRTIERTIFSLFFTGTTSVQGLEGAIVDVMVHPNAHATQLFGFASRWYFSIIIFLLGLGIITAFVVITGGARAFVASVGRKVKTRKGVQFITVIVGIVLMIDDYFNAMVNGNVGKTLAQKHNLSRARVTYNVDSIAAPICIAAPVSSWAVAIMGNMARVFDDIGHDGNIFMDFIRMIPYHFYVFAAIGMVLLTIKFDFNMFSMKKYEDQMKAGKSDLSADENSVGLALADVESSKGTVWDFWTPIVCLVGATVGTMIVTGFQASSAEQIAADGIVYSIMDNMSLSMSLLLGGLSGGVSALYIGLRHVKAGEVTMEQYKKAVWAGLRSMRMAIGILCLSWILSSLIGRLEVGAFFASLIQGAGIYSGFIPLIMFITAAIMAFCIGTSWGTFAIVLPIAGAVAYAIDINLLLPAMSAVLSGAVFGDHASPISDTTVLSSAGASCKVIPHFESQLPYALTAAALAAVGYLGFGLTGNVFVGYITFGIAIAIVAFLIWTKQKSQGAETA